MNNEKDYLQELYKDIVDAVQRIQEDPYQGNLDNLRLCLDKFFSDSKCLKVLYTPNVDRMFFGAYVFPKITGDEVVDILFKNSQFRVKEYWLELDSKMFNDFMMLTPREIAALIMHDVAHMVNNSSPALVVKREIDKYLTSHNEVLKVSESVHYRGILAYGFADAMRKYSTIFELDAYEPDDIIDEFMQYAGFSDDIYSAFYKINQMWGNYNREVKNKFITLSWVLRIYKDIRHNRIPALEGIKRCIELSPSRIEQKELKNMGLRLERIDDDALLESATAEVEDNKLLKTLRESAGTDKSRNLYRSYSLMNCITEDMDNLVLKLQDQSYNEPNGLYDLLNNMNVKMAIIQDYITTNKKEMTKEEFRQWKQIFNKLDGMRKTLSRGRLYSRHTRLLRKYKGFVDQ